MEFFTQEYLQFFEDLRHNNNTDWFEANRSRYEQHVKAPFTSLVKEMIRRIKPYEPRLGVSPYTAIYRILKDDKVAEGRATYRTYMAANISSQGRKTRNYPGFYFQFGPEKGVVAGGLFMLDQDLLARIRLQISWHGTEFIQLLNEPGFQSKYGSLQGKKNKNLPAGLKAAAKEQPLIANKQFYYMAETPAELVLHPGLSDVLMEFYKTGRPINEFLRRAAQSEKAAGA